MQRHHRISRALRALVAALVLAGLLAPATSVSAASTVPKVVVVVGPAGGATARYLAEARAAADLARRYTPDVTELYTPNATWPAVRAALQGASVVVYMGHGNGWPSQYRDSLYPPTQNGFGLDPVDGAQDGRHQYFGEAAIARDIRLAPDAVVLLHHLCYASGLSEPGLPEGTLEQARQRVDNYAAGFIAAGAGAVIAEAYASPDHMLRAVLSGQRSIADAWRTSPSANGNRSAFDSSRSSGYVAQMDTEGPTSGFERSIVLRAGLAPADVLRGARGSTVRVDPAIPDAPSLSPAGLAVSRSYIVGGTVAASTTRFKVLFEAADWDAIPRDITASVRWDPLDPPAEAPSDAPTFSLVVPERIGDVVAPAPMKLTLHTLGVDVAVPATPGRYRLVATLHDAEGVAFDAATQALVPALLVRVTGDQDMAIAAPDRLEVTAGADVSVPLFVGNIGQRAWGQPPEPDLRAKGVVVEPAPARVVGQWLTLGQLPMTADAAAADLPAGLAPGASAPADLATTAPERPGDYLLVLDVVLPDGSSLTALGAEPTLIRVTVVAAGAQR